MCIRDREYPEWVDVFERCYTDTLDNTVEILEDGSTFVLTGDIPAMWLRDSTAQLRPYLHVAKVWATESRTVSSRSCPIPVITGKGNCAQAAASR